jgi:NitT/TauT family transport system substrate-binding protein
LAPPHGIVIRAASGAPGDGHRDGEPGARSATLPLAKETKVMPRCLIVLLAFLLPALPVAAQTKITFGTDWLAEAEHGGFYQALARGFYAKHGLDVTIRMGGPQTNPEQQVATGVVDVQMNSGSFGVLNLVRQSIPVVAVAALFQKDPQVLISHPGAGNDTLAAMKGKPIMISGAARNGYWQFLKARFGFTDDQIRPYNFQMAPFLADRNAIQQGFVTSEPYQIERVSGEKPVVNLLADNGYASYCDILLVQARMIRERPEIVRAFVEASIEGWYSYLYEDPEPGNALIRAANKDITQDTIDNSIRLMKQYGLVDSGDSLTLGIGAMTDARWKSFFDTAVEAGLYKPDMDYKRGYTLQFVNQRHAIGMRKP